MPRGQRDEFIIGIIYKYVNGILLFLLTQSAFLLRYGFTFNKRIYILLATEILFKNAYTISELPT
jgi:hypothetical protein